MQKPKIALITLSLVLGILMTAGLAQAAVSLSEFTGRWEGSTIFLDFTTGSESDHTFFYVYRSTENLPIVNRQIDISQATRIVPESENTGTTTINQGGVFNAAGPCGSTGQDYEISDTPASGDTVYYYYLESHNCSGEGTEFHGNNGDTAGLEVRQPGSQQPTNTPTASATQGQGQTVPSATPTVSPTNTPPATAQANTETQPTAGPTGTLIPTATTGAVVNTPTTRPNTTATTVVATATTAATATNRPAPTTGPQQTQPQTVATTAPQPTQANNQPTVAPQPTIATQPTESVATVAPVLSEGSVATETTAPEIVAAFTPVSTAEAVGGTMAQNNTAPTPTLPAGFAGNTGAEQPTDVEGPTDPSVAGQTDTGGIDRMIQGLIAVILIGVIGLGGFLGWSYFRSRA